MTDPVALSLWCVAALLATAVLGVALSRSGVATRLVYGVATAISVAALLSAAVRLLNPLSDTATLILPLGLPWIGAHFRLDVLSAFFLIVVNLGGGQRPVSTDWVTVAMNLRRTAYCPSFPRFLLG